MAQFQAAIERDRQWTESTKNLTTSVKFTTSGTGESYLLKVDRGVSSGQKTDAETPAEFAFETTYDIW
jgi:hypothetical protein